ncbi:hypothetical protein CR513_20650, partial [Mucuna pruriens]
MTMHMDAPSLMATTIPAPPQPGDSSRPGLISCNLLNSSLMRSGPVASSISSIEHIGHLNTNIDAMSLLE